MAREERPALVIILTPGRFCGVKKRGSIVALREKATGFAPSVVVVMRSRVCCKPFLPVRLKRPDGHNKRENVTLLIRQHLLLLIRFLVLQIAFVHNVMLALHPLPASHLMINGSGMAASGTINTPLCKGTVRKLLNTTTRGQ
ncbi:hypothetical protein CgunFtcFv8_004663 [Champsocephalus gunnari]|uniref:Uncharacterized protein n=1 Tax=Champsocephalus gunnari TaxID=52237 RepID=A0AAN8HXS4_CHAGU|nr:hypothetical protein CgunFtcFv8_004663 [Champsocephalus gunnari]